MTKKGNQMTTQTLIYVDQDHKRQPNVIHAEGCAEGRKAHGYCQEVGNWDRVENVTTREELITELRNVYGDEEVEEYILPSIKWEPCVKIK